MTLRRRTVLAALAAAAVTPAAAQALDGAELGLLADGSDQSGALQDALLRAASEGRPLYLRAGTYTATNLLFPSDIVVEGVPGATVLAALGEEPVARISGNTDVTLRGLSFSAGTAGPTGANSGLLEIEASDGIRLDQCSFSGGGSNGLTVRDAAVRIENCRFSGHQSAAILSTDGRGIIASGNIIRDCGNGGIVIQATEPGRRDGSILTGNSISRIDWQNGGSGQNGNGIRVFRAAEVLVADNHVADCAFSAIRIEGSRDCQASGNLCINCGDVAIICKGGFSGALIADNIIDNAATGIAFLSAEARGQLAVCSSNLVRNISETSAVNPETGGTGILAEAETIVSGNTISTVVGLGIRAGPRGPVSVTGNTIASVNSGIGVVLDDTGGVVSITGNQITQVARGAIVGLRGEEVVEPDLARNVARYPQLSLGTNQVT